MYNEVTARALTGEPLPLKEMRKIAEVFYGLNGVGPINIYGISFDSPRSCHQGCKNQFVPRIHCGKAMFESLVEQLHAPIVEISDCLGDIHLIARTTHPEAGYLELVCIYDRKDLQVVESNVFEDIDSTRDLITIYAALKDWEVRI